MGSRLPILTAIAVAVFVLVSGLFLIFTRADREPTRTSEQAVEVPIGGPFTLVNARGEPVTDETFRGKYLLVFFGFTHCPDICPMTLDEMGRALEALGPVASQVTPIFVTVDPERDTPEVVGDFAAFHDSRIVGLTGTPEQIASVAKSYKVYAEKQDLEGGGYTVNHSTLIFIMGPDGKFRDLLSHDQPAEAIAKKVRDIMKKDGA